MANRNSNLHAAKKAKCDEFYTQLTDIEKELCHYKEQFEGKTVYCNCDNPDTSNFTKYFKDNFDALKLKRLVSTGYDAQGRGKALDYDGQGKTTELQGNGDFRSEECVELLKQADIVVTNPPFSLFREYVAQLMQYGKKFLIIGNMNAVTYKEIFPLFMNGKMWFGISISSGDRKFYVPQNYTLNASTCGIDNDGKRFIHVKGVRWFTNMETNKQNYPKCLTKTYNEKDYHKFDNYDSINVDKVKDIPYDHEGVIGVPITILNDLCSDGLLHFEVPLKKKERTESSDSDTATTTRTCQSTARHHTSESSYNKYRIIDANDCHRQGKRKSTMLVKDADSAINGKPTYARILIQRVQDCRN